MMSTGRAPRTQNPQNDHFGPNLTKKGVKNGSKIGHFWGFWGGVPEGPRGPARPTSKKWPFFGFFWVFWGQMRRFAPINLAKNHENPKKSKNEQFLALAVLISL